MSTLQHGRQAALRGDTGVILDENSVKAAQDAIKKMMS